jgi:hypothetical protein
LSKEINAFWESGIIYDIRNYTTGLATLGLGFFISASFIIEKIAAKYLTDKIVSNFLTICVAILYGCK